MAKLTLQDITGGYTGPARINANNALIEDALENTLSRDGTAPNQMEALLDMNGFRIINLGSPQSPTDAARLVDITGLITLTGMPIPSVVGNDGKLLFTDGTDLYWGDIDPDALPLFTSSARGAVPNSPSMLATVLLWGDGAWATPASRNIAMTNAVSTFTRAQLHQFSTVTFGGTSTINTQLSNQYKLTLTGNSTIAFSNQANGTNFTLVLIQDGTGNRTVTWPAIDWVDGDEPTLAVGANEYDLIKLRYDGTTWFGEHQGPNASESTDPEDFDLAITRNEDNVDVFRRLGSPLSAGTFTVLIDDGVVISSRSTREAALKFGGAFASGTVINVTNRGYVVAKGGRGGDATALTAATGVVWALGYSNGERGGDAIEGPATGVTVNITNSAGRIWGGGGGAGAGGASGDNAIAAGGAGGGGAGCGPGGKGVKMKMSGDSIVVETDHAADGALGLDGADAGGDGATGDGGGSGSPNGGNGGDGGDYGEAGATGAAAADEGNLIITPGTGGAAGRAITAGYTGTLNITSGGTSPNVKGAV